MTIYKEDLIRSCFRCQNEIKVKHTINRYSQKNNWGWWTDKEEYKEKYICDNCLEKLYYKNKKEYLKSITNQTKRATLRKYLSLRK